MGFYNKTLRISKKWKFSFTFFWFCSASLQPAKCLCFYQKLFSSVLCPFIFFWIICLCYVLLCSMWLWEYMCPHCTWSQEAFCLAFGFHFCHGHKNEGFLKIGCWSGLSYLLLLFCSSYKHFFFLYKFVVFTENCSIFQKLHDLAAQWVSWHFLYSTPS